MSALISRLLILLLILGAVLAAKQPDDYGARRDATPVPDRAGIDERQARMSLHTESPRAKVRREMAFRNTLAARRRKILRQRAGASAETMTASATSARRSSTGRRRPVHTRETLMGDVLEMQESQNGVYVTVPESAANDTHEIVIETLGGGSTGSSSTVSSTKRNSTSTPKPYRGANTSSLEHRGKKIVAMPASLYNHFRPVESNIPIEDMSQFLYFGQKLRGTGLGKDSSPASPSPKKLLAGLEEILDDEMNSVDRNSGVVSSKSTKMRTISFRDSTTTTTSTTSTTTTTSTARPACPDKEAETRANSINTTSTEKSSNNSTGLSLRIVVTEATTVIPISTTTGSTRTAIGESTSTTTVSSTTTLMSVNATEETPRSISRSKQEQQQQQPQKHVTEQQPAAAAAQQRQRSALRNSHVAAETGAGGPITSSSSPAAAAATRLLSAGATVEQAVAAPQSAPQQRASQQQQQPGFTIRWTDARPAASGAASKRRRLAAAAAASKRRDKSARTMEEPTSSAATAALVTTADDAAAAAFPVTPKIIMPEETSSPSSSTTSTEPPLETTTIVATTIGKMLDPSEVQKMYRSGSTAKPEATTMTSSALPSTELVDEPATTIVSTSTTISSSTTTTARPVAASPERSPEVRARNLADKAKDDVLPIMQLYNTSSMFNASESPSSTSTTTTTTTTTTTVLPTEVPVEPTTPTATTTIVEPMTEITSTTTSTTTTTTTRRAKPERSTTKPPAVNNGYKNNNSNKTGSAKPHRRDFPGEYNGAGYYPLELSNNNVNSNFSNNRTFFEPAGFVTVREPYANISEVISRRHDGDALASQETVAVVSYILATLVVFPIAVGVGLILRRLILRNRKVLEESDTSSEISCRKDALNLENGDFKMSIEKTITKLPRIQHLCHEAEKPPPPSSQESRWEFPRDKLRLQTVLGEGNFGQVWKAEADDLTGHQGTTRLVAVKTVKEGASDREKEDLVRELEIMQRVGSHPNVVTLLGCCTEQEPHYLILEYVMYGKLLAYLRDHRTRQDFYNFSEDSAALTSRDLTVFGYCVARGMEYLASKKIIHRDLAARNVLVDHNKLCKIADFGMSRFANEDGEVIETRHGRNALPIRWMAPESLIYSLFTTKTDVWSFGILMWEIVTLGSTPYPDMTAREVMRSVQSGYRLERPSHCRSELFRVIARCWHADPDRRPEFQVLRRDMAQLLEDNMNGHYVDLESFASENTD